MFYFCLFSNLIQAESSSTEESYQTPNRIHIFLANNIIISDYVFPDETSMDISERVKELFNYDIESENQIVYAEDLPRKQFFLFVVLVIFV